MSGLTQDWQKVLDKMRELCKSPSPISEGEVVSVSLDKTTIEVLPYGSNVPLDVQLRAGQQPKGFALVPAIGSRVIFGWLGDSAGFLLQAEEISEVVIDANLLIEGKITINNGALGGMLNAQALLAELVKMQIQVEAILALPATLSANGVVPVTPFEIALVAAISGLEALPKPIFGMLLIDNKITH